MEALLQFIRELKVHNSREWMDRNRSRYEGVRDYFKGFTQELIDRRREFDSSIEKLETKQCIFRINRDIRFSKNKTPYKEWLACAIAAEGGKKSWKAGYYLHLEPGDRTLIAGGLWQPDGPLLKVLREKLATDYKTFNKILNREDFKDYFGGLLGDTVKTAPKGFKKDHPAIDLLRMKSFHFVHGFTDKEVLAKDFQDKVIEGFKRMKKINTYFNKTLQEALKNGKLDERLVKKEKL